MAFDKEEFRKKIAEKAKARAKAHLKETEEMMPEEPISDEEKRVVEQYRQWKKGKTTTMNEKQKRILEKRQKK